MRMIRSPILQKAVSSIPFTVSRRQRSPSAAVNEIGFPAEATDEDRRVLDEALKISMTSLERLWALRCAVRYVGSNNIVGDLVECGVWKGGSARVMAETALSSIADPPNIWLYDTFAGMTQPTDRDWVISTGQSATTLMEASLEQDGTWARANLDSVRTNVEIDGYPRDKFRYVVGDVLETIPAEVPDRISVLRLDTDWFESTYHELQHLHPRVSSGGVVIVDDYGHFAGARDAVDTYFREIDFKPLVIAVDYTARLWLKP